MASVVNYSIYPLISRVTDPRNTADVVISLSIISQVVGIMSAANIVSFYINKVNKDKNKASQESEDVQKMFIFICFILYLIFIIFAPIFLRYIGLPSFWYLVPIGIIINFSVPLYIWTGIAQATNKLGKLGLITLLSSILQLIFSLVLGMKYNGLGVVTGVAIGQLLALIVFYVIFKSIIPPIKYLFSKKYRAKNDTTKKYGSYFLTTLISVLVLTSLQAIDIFLVKKYFPNSYENYSLAFLAGRVIFFIGIIGMWTILPKIDVIKPENNYILLKKTFYFYTIISASILIIGLVSFERIISILFNKIFYEPNYNLTILASISHQLIILLVTFIVTYYLCIRNIKGLYLSLSVLLFHMLILIIKVNIQNLIILLSILSVVGLLVGFGLSAIIKVIKVKYSNAD